MIVKSVGAKNVDCRLLAVAKIINDDNINGDYDKHWAMQKKYQWQNWIKLYKKMFD